MKWVATVRLSTLTDNYVVQVPVLFFTCVRARTRTKFSTSKYCIRYSLIHEIDCGCCPTWTNHVTHVSYVGAAGPDLDAAGRLDVKQVLQLSVVGLDQRVAVPNGRMQTIAGSSMEESSAEACCLARNAVRDPGARRNDGPYCPAEGIFSSFFLFLWGSLDSTI